MIDSFLNYLKFERNRSELTVKSYADDLRAFEHFFRGLDDGLDWKDIDMDIVRQWMEHMMDSGNKPTSVRRRLSALRSFYRYALSRNLVEADPTLKIKLPKTAKPLPQFVKEKEMDQLLGQDLDAADFIAVRNYTITALLYATGMRMAELMGLDDADVDFKGQSLKVTGKRNKQRIIPFGKETAEILHYYIYIRQTSNLPSGGPLFVSSEGTRMTRSQIGYAVRKELSKVTTLKKRSPHVLRHSFATGMLNHDASLEAVRKLLGHASLATTQIYTHTTFEQLRQSYHKAHPREKKDGES